MSNNPKLRIAVIGAGNVGTTLGKRFSEAGHTVVYGVRSSSDAKYQGLTVAGIREAAASADVVLLTTPWAAAQDALQAAGDLAGKVLIDATNPIGPGMVLTHGTTDSGAEQVARWSPGARVVKAFNSIGREIMANPTFGAQRSVLWLCGDDQAACDTVAGLAQDIGFDPLRIGLLARARFVEPAALLWITATAALATREFSWGLLRR